MCFEDIPEDRCISLPCYGCGGNITEYSKGVWACDSCDFEVTTQDE